MVVLGFSRLDCGVWRYSRILCGITGLGSISYLGRPFGVLGNLVLILSSVWALSLVVLVFWMLVLFGV